MSKVTTKAILKAVGSDKLELAKGDGYYYFIYDNRGNLYEIHTVYCMYLSHMSVERWAKIGRSFVAEREASN